MISQNEIMITQRLYSDITEKILCYQKVDMILSYL